VSAQSNSVTPTGLTAPTAPTNVTATPASRQALVSWTAPSNGGSTITGYTITPYIGSQAQTATQVINGSATSAAVSGLTNGTSYTFTVSATNAVGTGPASTATNAVTPEDTIFDFGTPATIDAGDPSGTVLGTVFTPSVNGTATGVRFYKAAANTGTHVGSLWTASGQLLASATFTNETASGWQTVQFSNPVGVTAGSGYVVSYYAPNGHYSATGAAFNSAVTNGPLIAPASGTNPNGVYAYGAGTSFPTNGFNATNYWVDVLFAPSS
jgi:hypothetical protein